MEGIVLQIIRLRPEGHFHVPSPLTPKVIIYFRVRGGYAELSEGQTADNVFVYSVRVSPYGEKSKCFARLNKAMEYIGTLS
jgi:hypothetical protein